jgi:hypothetical protein
MRISQIFFEEQKGYKKIKFDKKKGSDQDRGQKGDADR